MSFWALNIPATCSQGAHPSPRPPHLSPRAAQAPGAGGNTSHVALTPALPACSPWGIFRLKDAPAAFQKPLRGSGGRGCAAGGRAPPLAQGLNPSPGGEGLRGPRGGARHRLCASAAPRELAAQGGGPGKRERAEGRARVSAERGARGPGRGGTWRREEAGDRENSRGREACGWASAPAALPAAPRPPAARSGVRASGRGQVSRWHPRHLGPAAPGNGGRRRPTALRGGAGHLPPAARRPAP